MRPDCPMWHYDRIWYSSAFLFLSDGERIAQVTRSGVCVTDACSLESSVMLLCAASYRRCQRHRRHQPHHAVGLPPKVWKLLAKAIVD